MNNHMRALSSIIGFASASIAFAQNDHPTVDQLNWLNNERTFQRLNLTADQTTRMRDAFERRSKEMQETFAIQDPEARVARLEASAEENRKVFRSLLTKAQLDTLEKMSFEFRAFGEKGPMAPTTPDAGP